MLLTVTAAHPLKHWTAFGAMWAAIAALAILALVVMIVAGWRIDRKEKRSKEP